MARKEKATKVRDGDSFKTANRKRDVRLNNVNAPEKGERGYGKAKTALQKMIENKIVEIKPVARDSYGRTVANVTVEGESVNKAMRDITKKK